MTTTKQTARRPRSARFSALVKLLNTGYTYTMYSMSRTVSKIVGYEVTVGNVTHDLRYLERKGRIAVVVVNGRILGETVDSMARIR